MTTTTENQPTAWCPVCKTRRALGDAYHTDSGDELPEFRTYYAQPLECGHDAGDTSVPRRPFRPLSPALDADLVARLVRLQDGARRATEQWADAMRSPVPF